MLKIRLFGSGEATFRDRPLPGFPQQQIWLLLSYLILNRTHPQNRERLAAVFWGDQPAHIARKNFRNTLWRMRQMLSVTGAQPDEYIHISDTSISFINYSDYWLDVDVFENASRYSNLPDPEITSQQVKAMETAVQVYQGDLLEGIYEDWCLYERERLRLLFLNMAHRLLAYHSNRGDYATALQYSERILRCESTREDVHRQVMWLYAQMGNRAAALAQYKICCQLLMQELGVKPSDNTNRLYEELLHVPETSANRFKTPDPFKQDPPEGFVPIAQNALKQLEYLQQVLEQTNTELEKIEQMIHRALGETH